jgi:adenylate kinase
MIIALSGTPGTGKTTVCDILKQQFGYNIININRLVIDEKLNSGKDEDCGSLIADIEKLGSRVQEILNPADDSIIEGHFSHLLPTDAVIVLRTEPLVLKERLGKRNGYSYQKIKENADAEALDVILVEAYEQNNYVFEINTTDMAAIDVAKSVVSIIETLKKGKTPVEFLPGKIDWIEQVLE